MSWRQWSIPVLWFGAVLSVVGQSTDVTQCVSNSTWSTNELGQNACAVASVLESACGELTRIPALPIGTHYLGPNASEANPCRCSSVTYSMISACADCQGRSYIDWLRWSQNCTSIFFTTFPEPLPSTVEVPSWAYLNLSLTNNNFSVAAAEQNASETSTTSSAITTSTSVSNSLTSSTTALASTASAVNSKSNAGAIAGGVVGGIALVAIVGLGTLWFCLRRKRNTVQKNVAFDSRALVSGTAMSQTTGSTQGGLSFLPQRSQTIYTSNTSLSRGTPYPGSPLATVRRGSSDSLVPPSMVQFGGSQTHPNVPLVPPGYTGMPEI